MTLSAPNNPVEARGKASKRAESRLMAVRHGSCGKPGKAVVHAGCSEQAAKTARGWRANLRQRGACRAGHPPTQSFRGL